MSRPTTMKVDGTVYWAIFTYTDEGILVDTDITPSVSVRKNGAAVGDVVTVTKRGTSTGVYDCTHNPAGEIDGDTLAYEEAVIISGQPYLNRWSLEVRSAAGGGGGGDATAANQATIIADIAALNDFDPASDTVLNVTNVAVNADMRGTDGANTVAPDNASIASILIDAGNILADTNELQQNQGDWATADVSGLAQESSVDDLESDVTDIKNVIATTLIPNQVTANALLAGIDSVTDKLDTTLQQDGSNYQFTVDALVLAPTGSGGGGGSGDSAATIYNYFTTNSREDAFKADVSGLATSSEVSLISVPSESDVYNYFTSGSREDQFKADTSGLSTLSASEVGSEVISGLNAYDAAKGSEITSARNEIVSDIAGLNNFDPAYDTVVNVGTVQNVVNGGSGGGGGDATAANQTVILSAINDLNDFDPSSDVVQNVNTVQTVINGGGSGGGGGGTITVKATPTPRAF